MFQIIFSEQLFEDSYWKLWNKQIYFKVAVHKDQLVEDLYNQLEAHRKVSEMLTTNQVCR